MSSARKRDSKIVFVLVIIVILLSVDIERGISESRYFNENERVKTIDEPVREVYSAEAPQPRRPFSLRNLVDELLSVTPSGANDTDGDLLPDSVEAVIGTHFNNTDTDFDSLNDTFEIYNDLDPLEPDTNFDNYPDNLEVGYPDIDNDGEMNGWDSDNDGDGVPDVNDISPMVRSESTNKIHLEIDRNGEPVFISFQVRPTDASHLLRYDSWYNWPYDEEGLMRDLDNSLEDLNLIPTLRVTTSVELNASDAEAYNIVTQSYGFDVSLTPVWDVDELVAFNAKIYLPESLVYHSELDIELVWSVIGHTDTWVTTLESELGVMLATDESTFVSCSDSDTASEFSLIPTSTSFNYLTSETATVAFETSEGYLLSVNEDGLLETKSTTLGLPETFTLFFEDADLDNPSQRKALVSDYLGRYWTIEEDGVLRSVEFNPDNLPTQFYFSADDVSRDATTLVSYTDPFICTGFVVEEFHSSQIGLFFSDNRNQSIAASIAMESIFLRNDTNSLSDLGGILADNGVGITSQVYSFPNRYIAAVNMSNTHIPDILGLLPSNEVHSITIGTEDQMKVIEMSELLSGTYVAGSSFSVDLQDEPTAAAKQLRVNFYNTSSYEYLSLIDIFDVMDTWGLDEEGEHLLGSFLTAWNSGEIVVSGDGLYNMGFAPPLPELLLSIGTVATGLITGIATIGYIVSTRGFNQVFNAPMRFLQAAIKQYKDIRIGTQAKALIKAGKPVTLVSKVSNGNLIGKLFNLDVILTCLGIAIDIGFSIWGGVSLAEGLSTKTDAFYAIQVGATFGSVSVITSLLVGTLLIALTILGITNPLFSILGFVIGLAHALGSIMGNWVSRLAGAITEWLLGAPDVVVSVSPYFDVVNTDTSIVDYSSNGLTVDDRIEFTATIIAGLNGTTDENDQWAAIRYMDRSFNGAWVSALLPSGSSSLTGTDASYTFNPIADAVRRWLGTHWEEYWQDNYIQAGGLNPDLTVPWFYVNNTCQSTTWVIPGVAMPNYPMNVRFNSRTRCATRWYNEDLFGYKHYHWKTDYLSNSSDFSLLYFDVFPATFNNFLRWSAITPVDSDFDGLANDDEPGYRAGKFDYDSDGLNDAFEVREGYDPEDSDMDNDGLFDEWEIRYGTNITDDDTDGDGLRDYREIAGWEVHFTYNNTPFIYPAHSDPRIADSDGDGLDDAQEYWSNTNPRSNDTNGDGIGDELNPSISTEIVYETSWGTDLAADTGGTEILTDSDGIIYVLLNNGGYILGSPSSVPPASVSWIQRLDDNLENVSSGPLFQLIYESETTHDIAINDVNGTLFYRGGSSDAGNQIYVFDLDGTQTVGLYEELYHACWIEEMAFASPDKLLGYWFMDGPQVNWIEATLIDNETYTNDHKSDLSSVYDPMDVAYSSVTEKLYIACTDEVWVIDTTESEAPYCSPGSFTCASGLDVADNGFVYVADAGEDCIKVFDSNGEPYTYWGDNGRYGLSGQESTNFTNPVDVAVDSFGNMYVLENWVLGVRVQKFSLSGRAVSDLLPFDGDSDGDQLLNIDETTGWEISITDSSGAHNYDVTSNPLLNDTDFDELTDFREWELGTDTRSPDSDADNLQDHIEVEIGTDPTHWDSDGDLLGDGSEIAYGSDPLVTDSDSDGLSDLEEYLLGTDANNPDSDGDGLGDNLEFLFNSSLTSPDSDGDFMFDNLENTLGTNPNNGDCDGDSLSDGFEAVFNLNPLDEDSDGDGANDALELSLWLDPLNNDTDGDGILDMLELERGTNPRSNDTDWDGVPDGLDPDSYYTDFLDVVLACDADVLDESQDFRNGLEELTDLTISSYDDLVDNYQDEQYIVLVGSPESGGEGVGGLMYELLEDSGQVLEDMMLPGAHEVVVRHGTWSSTQTIVLLSQAYKNDVYAVMAALRGREVTILPDAVSVTFQSTPAISGVNAAQYTVAEIDTFKQTDAIVSFSINTNAEFVVQIKRYNFSTTPHELTQFSGLVEPDQAMEKYLEVDVLINGEPTNLVDSATILMYYRHSDLDRDGNGMTNDSLDFNETLLVLYYYNESLGIWMRMSTDLDWVIDMGVYTQDVEIYGEMYAGYVWAQVKHLSLFTIAGQLNEWNQYLSPAIIVLIFLGGIGIASVVIMYRRKRRAKEHTGILGELSDG